MAALCGVLWTVVAAAAAASAASCAEGSGGAVCMRKCCPLGEIWNRSEAGIKCERSATAFSAPLLLDSGAVVAVEEARLRGGEWRVVTGRPTCPEDKPIRARVTQVTDTFYLQPDGTLYVRMPHKLFGKVLSADEYCLETFAAAEGGGGAAHQALDALVCFPEDQPDDNTIATTGMLISSVFLLLTLAVYAAVPELRNMHGRVLMAYLASLLVGFLLLATLQLAVRLSTTSQAPSICVPFSIVIYFSLLAAFFWLNVMCFDIWWTFSGYSHVTRAHAFARRRYAWYCAYAFGIPSVLTALLAALEFADNVPDYIVTPKLNQQNCFLSADERLLYLYCPMLILCVANGALFVATAMRIALVRRQTAVLKGGESATHDQYHKDKQRLFLYVKLFVVMGVNWVLEVVSALFPRVPVLWKITDAYNVLMGLTIFIIFICKRKIFRLLKKRYDVARGAPPTRSYTCSTRNTSTVSREEIRMPPLPAPTA